MVCDECKERPASVFVTIFRGEEKTVRNLCPQCAAKLRKDMGSGLLPNLLTALAGKTETDIEILPCPVCGKTFEDFKKTGRLGCVSCYQAFRTQLSGMMAHLHGAALHHAEQTPPRETTRMQLLQRQMDEAVQAERYEDAAKLRDEINELRKGGAQA